MENPTQKQYKSEKEFVLSIFPNSNLIKRENSNYPFIVASYGIDNKQIEHYLSIDMVHCKTEIEAWRAAQMWVNHTLGNTLLHKSTNILELTNKQREIHLERLYYLLESDVEYQNGIIDELGMDKNDPETIKLQKNIEKDIKTYEKAIEGTREVIEKANIGYGPITLKDIEEAPIGILLNVDSDFYTFNPKAKFQNFTDEEFKKLLASKETKNDLVMINFKTKYLAQTQSVLKGDLKAAYPHEIRILNKNQIQKYIDTKHKEAQKQYWLESDTDNDGLTNRQEIENGTDVYTPNIKDNEKSDSIEILKEDILEVINTSNNNKIITIEQDDAAPDAIESLKKEVLEVVGTPLETIKKEMELKNIIGDTYIYVWNEFQVKVDPEGLLLTNNSKIKNDLLPEGTGFRIAAPTKENDNKFTIEKKHKQLGWRTAKTSRNFPKISFNEKSEALKVYQKMQTKEIKKNKSKGII